MAIVVADQKALVTVVAEELAIVVAKEVLEAEGRRSDISYTGMAGLKIAKSMLVGVSDETAGKWWKNGAAPGGATSGEAKFQGEFWITWGVRRPDGREAQGQLLPLHWQRA